MSEFELRAALEERYCACIKEGRDFVSCMDECTENPFPIHKYEGEESKLRMELTLIPEVEFCRVLYLNGFLQTLEVKERTSGFYIRIPYQKMAEQLGVQNWRRC
jgi:hypothetical protein